VTNFRFRLATLLKLREAARDARRQHLAQAYEAETALREQQARMADEMVVLRQNQHRAAGPGPVAVDHLVETQRYQLVLTTQRQVIEEREKLVAAEIERRRQALLEAERDVRTLEKLRQKQHQRHADDQSRRQVKQLDEIAQRAKREDGS
jgi:flagellar export protein FliJ